MKDMKIVKSLEESGLLLKCVSETIENEAKEQIGVFSGISVEILAANLLGNMLAGKGVIRAGEGVIATSQGRGSIRAGQEFLMSPHWLNNFEIQKYQNEPNLKVTSATKLFFGIK